MTVKEHDFIQNPPKSLLKSIKFLGPGLILSAAIVGSGELIATTILGAKTGFVLLWVILLACLFKVAIQIEYGRYCITHGKSSFYAWNDGKGFKIFGLNWSIYFAFLFLLSMFIGQGGVIGGASQLAFNVVPALTIYGWTLLVAIIVALLIFHGKYKPIEIISIVMNTLFIIVIFYCVYKVQETKYAFTVADISGGLVFKLPPEGAVLAFSVFGIVGLGAGEIVIYPYWCLEKGYAAYCGPKDGTEEWYNRAKGWTKVMMSDAFVSMIVYTLSTCAFYILGATILQSQNTLQDGNNFVLQLSGIFTEVLGKRAEVLFIIGAFCILFSTAFANTAGFSRMWTDFLALCRIIDIRKAKTKKLTLAVLAWLLPLSWGAVYLFMQKPQLMIILMGVANTLFLLIVAFKALTFRYCFSDPKLKPSKFYDICLLISTFAIVFMGIKSLLGYLI